ncbi:MAG TPA: quinoprotein dehydrogenase-associated SoxYZ-like carrier [Methylibium sp.]|uniref:quinoprotein dehydrogenase-associated SoxYZ-like carrier n=1 Tax=Methylibium sp. TaxID=2067992 RepID=UPI002DBB867E|nr:quinoprotein dehydrogenase-associated SoxYZ-like carrier [Methylibium sp.]HEU4460308.1 quinoprotein dehydrogenase-associated SoxYZ-like carrier [Methylibium sp.]
MADQQHRAPFNDLPQAPDPGARLARIGLPAALGLWPLLGRAADDTADNERWQAVRKGVFEGRPISENAKGIVELETPVRAADGAVVPIAIHTPMVQTPERWIRKLWLVIDRNPSPVGVRFDLTPTSGRAEIETRVRIEEYTHVRAVAELNDGKLVMDKRYVKASGGCSAPAGKDMAEALATLGRMKLKLEGEPVAGKPLLAQLMVSHPNISGLAIDQLTRLAPAPHYVKSVAVSYAGKPVLSADVDFTISENPSLRFWFVPGKAEGELRAEVIDNQERRFQSAIPVRSAA